MVLRLFENSFEIFTHAHLGQNIPKIFITIPPEEYYPFPTPIFQSFNQENVFIIDCSNEYMIWYLASVCGWGFGEGGEGGC